MKILLDTSIIIDFQRRKEKKDSLVYKFRDQDLYSSIITHTEVYSGKSVWEKILVRNEIEDLFLGIQILPLTQEISEFAGKIKAFSHDRNIIDCIIAATALYHNLELATLNRKDFEVIKGIKLLGLN